MFQFHDGSRHKGIAQERTGIRPRNERAQCLHPRRQHSERHIRSDEEADRRRKHSDEACHRPLRLDKGAEEYRHERGRDRRIQRDSEDNGKVLEIEEKFLHAGEIDKADRKVNEAHEQRDDEIKENIAADERAPSDGR